MGGEGGTTCVGLWELAGSALAIRICGATALQLLIFLSLAAALHFAGIVLDSRCHLPDGLSRALGYRVPS